MLTVKLICVGKLKEEYWRKAISEYEKRLTPFCKFSIIEVAEARLPENPSSAQIEDGLLQEASAIEKHLAGKVMPLCIEGKAVSSPKLAGEVEKAMQAPGSISFVIGSSFGLHKSVKDKGTGISMSDMTFPHQLARVMLCEQIYRAFQILNNSKYHK